MQAYADYSKHVFQFNFKARTSRGLMKDKISWFIKLHDKQKPDIFGVGECGPLPGLSEDATPEYEDVLKDIIRQINNAGKIEYEGLQKLIPSNYPSIRFGLETALLDLSHGGKRIIFQNDFVQGKKIPINGLIWMGDLDFMMNQINVKIAAGFRCIKLKVGGLDFDRECDTLQYIRKRYFRDNIEIRLDANGAFKLDDALYKISELAKYNVHSIEQPIKPNLPEMEELCRKSPIPVAFDEELIGIHAPGRKRELLTALKPRYIILKPSLHGGISGCEEWIRIATEVGAGWWITSALESNVGLNAICQFTANYDVQIPQGLGTGSIYQNNIASPLHVEKGEIFWKQGDLWQEIA
jgi:o-succinylbenzoate synthase